MVNFTCSLAIIVGINNYHNGIAELNTARPDAEKLAGLLATDYKYQVELITDETDRKPTLAGIRTLLTEWLPQQLQPPVENNRLLFYFAGHGMPLESDNGPRGFLLPQDANPNPKPGEFNNFLPMQELHDALIALPCHHLLIILDCCFAGTFRWSSTRKAIPIPETIHRQHYDRFIRYPAWQVITSSAHNQEALDFLSDKRGTGNDAQHSPFAEALFEALQDGEPDKKGKRYKKADLTKDGVITAPELYLYLRDNVETRSRERQTPGLFPLKRHDRGEYIFHDPNFDPTTLSEAPELDEANNPYRGLKPFEEQHARLFFGRQELIKQLYARIAAPDRSLTVVLGVSGSGKSSLVKAGLIPDLKQRSQPEEFAIHLVKACILTIAILYSFAHLPHKPCFPLRFLPINYTHQWQILHPMRPGDSPFAALAKTLLTIADYPATVQLDSLDFLSEFLQQRHKQFASKMAEEASNSNSSKIERLSQETEQLLRIADDWNKGSQSDKQRLLVEQFEMLYALCKTEEQESEQQSRLKQAFQAILEPLTQQLQSKPDALIAIVTAWSQRIPDTKLLLVIDQFEELITLGRTTSQDAQSKQPEEWQQFLSLLETTLAANLPQLRIIVTLRSDFETRFLSSEALKPYWSKARFPVRAMRSDELRQAIEGPASEMALYFEPANLVNRLTDEVGQMPGALPLLSFTLSELYVNLAEKWRNQETSDRALTIDDQFDQEGGVAGSLTRRANEEYQRMGADSDLGEAGQLTMRRVMLRMLTLEGGETARRRVPDSELIYPTQEESDRVKAVVDRLVNARLLVRGQLETGEPYVEPAHDFLVRGWGILQDWINEEKAKETLELQQRLTAQANDWVRNQGPLLPDGDRLKLLTEVIKSTHNWLNQREIEFTNRSIAQAKKLRVRPELLGKAKRVEDLLQVQALEGLVLAIQAMGQNLEDCPEEILTPVQTSLFKAMAIAKISIPFQGYQGAISIETVAFSQDGQKIICSINDNKITRLMWDLKGNLIGQPLQLKWAEDEPSVWSVAFSPDGERIVTGSMDGKVRLWDSEGNLIGQPFCGHKSGIDTVAFCPDGQVIASGSRDRTIRLWNLQGDPIGQPFLGHDSEPLKDYEKNVNDDNNYLGFYPNENFGMGLGRRTPNFIRKPLLKDSSIHAVAFSPNGQMIVSAGDDYTVRLWDLKGNPIGQPFRGHEDKVLSVAFSQDGQMIVSGSYDKTLRLWDLQGNAIGQPFKGHDSFVSAVAFSQDGQIIVSGSLDKTLRLWDLQGNAIGQPFKGHEGSISAVAFSSDGQMIVSGGDHTDKTVRLWDLKDVTIGQPFKGHEERVNSVAFSPDGQKIVSGSGDKTMRIWDLEGHLLQQPSGEDYASEEVAFSPDGQTVISGNYYWKVDLWDLKSNVIRRLYENGAFESIISIAFYENGQMLIGTTGNTVRLWDREWNLIGQLLQGYEKYVISAAFSQDGQTMVTGDTEKKVQLWDLRKGKPTGQPFNVHTSDVGAVAFSPDGKTIVSGSSDKTIRLWDLQGNLIGQPFRGHDAGVSSVTFSPNGKMIASSSSDKTIRLWDLQGNPIGQPFRGHEDDIFSIAFSPNGQMIASGGLDKTVRLWRVNWQSWLEVCCNRVRYHPVFTDPESIEDPEQREIAIAACKTCEKYVWSKTESSVE